MAEERTTAVEPRPRRRTPTSVRIVLFVSLALNLLIVGIVVGVVLSGGPGGSPPRNVRDAVVPYTEALSASDRRQIGRKIFREIRQDGSWRDLREQAREDYTQALSLLLAQPFDRDAFADLVARQSAEASSRQARGQVLLIEHIAAMSPQERAAYAGRVGDALRRWNRRGDRRDRRD